MQLLFQLSLVNAAIFRVTRRKRLYANKKNAVNAAIFPVKRR